MKKQDDAVYFYNMVSKIIKSEEKYEDNSTRKG